MARTLADGPVYLSASDYMSAATYLGALGLPASTINMIIGNDGSGSYWFNPREGYYILQNRPDYQQWILDNWGIDQEPPSPPGRIGPRGPDPEPIPPVQRVPRKKIPPQNPRRPPRETDPGGPDETDPGGPDETDPGGPDETEPTVSPKKIETHGASPWARSGFGKTFQRRAFQKKTMGSGLGDNVAAQLSLKKKRPL